MVPKKLIYILNHYSENSAQHFFHVINLLKEIASKGVDITLVVEKCEGVLQIDHASIQVIAQQQTGRIARQFELFNILYNLSKRGYNKVFIRISLTAAVIAIICAMVSKLKVYFWHSGTVFEHNKDQPFSYNKFKDFVKVDLPFTFVKFCVNYFVTGPESMKNYYVQECKVPASKVKILYNDIDLKRFSSGISPEERRKRKARLGLNPDRELILFVHRLSPVRKSLYYIPYIFERFYAQDRSDFEVIIIGDGPERSELETQIRKKNLHHIRVLGEIPNGIIQNYYSVADMFINPTHAEGFPRVLIEAMACGLPIVTTDAGGIPDILGGKQSEFMVDKNDREAFALKLISLADSPDLRERISVENMERVKRYSSPKVAEMYVNTIFEEN